jgi:hypothetical protein
VGGHVLQVSFSPLKKNITLKGLLLLSNVAAYDAVIRLDGKIKHFVISPIAKELTEDSANRVKKGLEQLRIAKT